MHMLQVYIHKRNDNQEANAKKLAAVNELIYDINDLWYLIYNIVLSLLYIRYDKQ